VLVSPLIPAGTIYRVPDGSTPIDHTSVLKTIELRFGLPALTARDAAAPDLGGALTLTTPRTDDPLAGVVAPTATGPGPAAAPVTHQQQLQAPQTSDLPVPAEQLQTAPLLANLKTPADYDHYIATRTDTWRSAVHRGQAPGGAS
jgi:phospholipase C